MSWIYKTFLLLFLVGVFELRFGVAFNDDVINEYLVRTVDNDEQEANFEALNGWLKEKERYPTFFNQGLIKDLQSLVALTTTQDNLNCNRDGYNILVAASKVTGSKAETMKVPYEKCRRLDKIVMKAAEKHATECQDIYVKRFNDRVKYMDVMYLARVEDYMARVRNSAKIPQPDSDSIFSMGPMKCYNAVIESRWNAFESLKLLAKDEPHKFPESVREKDEHGKEKINKVKVKQFLKKYLLDSCEYYYRELADIFIPAEYDAKRSDARYTADIKFRDAWINFRLCGCLVNSDITPLIEGLNQASETHQVSSSYKISKQPFLYR